MDVDKLLEKLSPEERQALLKKLVAEEGETSDEKSDLEKRLERLERAMGSQSQGFEPWKMMSSMMGEFPMGGPPRSASAEPAQVFNALADETRLEIIRLLSAGEKSVEQLVDALGIAQSTTSHHLRVLKDAKLVKAEKRGRNTFYALTQPLHEDAH